MLHHLLPTNDFWFRKPNTHFAESSRPLLLLQISCSFAWSASSPKTPSTARVRYSRSATNIHFYIRPPESFSESCTGQDVPAWRRFRFFWCLELVICAQQVNRTPWPMVSEQFCLAVQNQRSQQQHDQNSESWDSNDFKFFCEKIFFRCAIFSFRNKYFVWISPNLNYLTINP